MNLALLLLILTVLACGASLILRRWIALGALRAVAAAALATALWIGGFYLICLLAAPSELGPPLLAPVVYTFLTALVPAAVTVGIQGVLEEKHSTPENDAV